MEVQAWDKGRSGRVKPSGIRGVDGGRGGSGCRFRMLAVREEGS